MGILVAGLERIEIPERRADVRDVRDVRACVDTKSPGSAAIKSSDGQEVSRVSDHRSVIGGEQ